MMEFNKSVEELKTSPIFAMSLGSKELFHSNFWAWILENADPDKEFLHLFFPEINEYDEVLREYHHMDISIWVGKEKNRKAYVIENKYKSIPNANQLEEYTKDLKKKNQFARGVITGIDIPVGFELPGEWIFVKYEDISKTIEKIANKLKDEDPKKSYLIDYVSMLNNLSQILTEYTKHFKNNLPVFDKNKLNKGDKLLKEAVQDLRISDLCQKHQECLFMADIVESKEYKEIIKSAKNRGMVVRNWAEFNNGKYCATFRIIKNESSKDQKHLGLQLEGNQYRITAEKLFKAKNKEINNEIVFNDEEFASWFIKDKHKNDGKKHSNEFVESSMKKPYCSYDSQSRIKGGRNQLFYSFVYQYWNITEDNNKFEILHRNIINDLQKALKILSK